MCCRIPLPEVRTFEIDSEFTPPPHLFPSHPSSSPTPKVRYLFYQHIGRSSGMFNEARLFAYSRSIISTSTARTGTLKIR